MFGLNDNNSQTNNNDMPPADAPPAAPPNPFGDTSPATPPPPPPTDPMQSAPISVPDLTEKPATSTPPMSSSMGSAPSMPSTSSDSLIDLKQQALQSLQPLVGKIDQTPEEKFKTTMMLIQASDNSALVKEAYAAANQIPDEKARAQALLDIVNEINYFTQKGEEQPKP